MSKHRYRYGDVLRDDALSPLVLMIVGERGLRTNDDVVMACIVLDSDQFEPGEEYELWTRTLDAMFSRVEA